MSKSQSTERIATEAGRSENPDRITFLATQQPNRKPPMSISKIHDGWLLAARRLPSTNCDPRPADTAINLLVIHNISLPPGEFGGTAIEDLFLNRLKRERHPYFAKIHDLRVSAHLLIDRHGDITQFVPFDLRAWHAGVSCYDDRECCNDFSIGIELEGTDDTPYTEAQYAALSATTRALLRHYPHLNPRRIAGHCDIAPGRKSDPGPAFDWIRYLASLHSHGQGL